jgi:hypothetical protein
MRNKNELADTFAHFQCAWNRYFSLTQGTQCMRFVKTHQNGRFICGAESGAKKRKGAKKLQMSDRK